MKSIDRTIVNIVSILVGAAGLFTVLTEFNVPELHITFFDRNPFAEKRAVIASTQSWVFTGLTLLGLVIQMWAQVAGSQLEERVHEAATYWKICASGIAVLALAVWGLSQLGYALARPKWEPLAVEFQREAFTRAAFVVANEGWTPEHLAQRAQIVREGNAPRYTKGNLENAERDVGYMEKLLEVEPAGTLAQRITRLRVFFEN